MPKGIPKNRYTPEFKQLVIETMRAEGISYPEMGERFEIKGHNCIKAWERIYLEEGPEGLHAERRGRASLTRGNPKGQKTRAG